MDKFEEYCDYLFELVGFRFSPFKNGGVSYLYTYIDEYQTPYILSIFKDIELDCYAFSGLSARVEIQVMISDIDNHYLRNQREDKLNKILNG